MSQGNKRVGSSPGARIAAESLLILNTKVQGKGVCFQVVGKFRVARHYKPFFTSFVNNTSALQQARLSGILSGQVPKHG